MNIDFNNKKATRQSYGEALLDLGKENKDVVVLDADLATATKTNLFAKEFPDRFFDMGIAEANMIGTAAGFATCGKIPYASTFAVFAAGRAYDQIRNSVCYPNLNVKICATHAGITVGEDGATHQMLEDLALMRVIPNMTVISPSDDIQTRWAIEEAHKKRYGNKEFLLELVYEEQAGIEEYLDNGYLKISLAGAYAEPFISQSQTQQKKIQKAEQKKERIEEKAIAMKMAKEAKK